MRSIEAQLFEGKEIAKKEGLSIIAEFTELMTAILIFGGLQEHAVSSAGIP